MGRFFLLLFLLPAVATGSSTEFYREDIIRHSQASNSLTVGGALALERAGVGRGASLFMASLACALVGLGKETIHDRRYSRSDMWGNAMGISTGILALQTIEF